MIPLTFVRLHLAQGIVFSHELNSIRGKLSSDDFDAVKEKLSKALTAEALSLSDIVITKSATFLRSADPSEIAASIIYYARRNILHSKEMQRFEKLLQIWPKELVLLT